MLATKALVQTIDLMQPKHWSTEIFLETNFCYIKGYVQKDHGTPINNRLKAEHEVVRDLQQTFVTSVEYYPMKNALTQAQTCQ